MDYRFLAGFTSGFIASVPISVAGIYLVYLKISAHIRAIVNEYGRG
ncbi:TPA_asm: Protein 3a [Kalanchoe marnieriana polerovirus]|uniref:Protein 3a n=1 Tax=Kalanchoe marnieriana polerovirus TaxID=2885086 RepID=A0AAD2KQ58_9VIRU|nr:TPA_asm: Protein 3a [Kalanchoe marnieriana polerovirus]